MDLDFGQEYLIFFAPFKCQKESIRQRPNQILLEHVVLQGYLAILEEFVTFVRGVLLFSRANKKLFDYVPILDGIIEIFTFY